jgi:hypothetical protein
VIHSEWIRCNENLAVDECDYVSALFW